MTGEWLLYGANGYTGELIARHAIDAGLRPVLAGRRGDVIERLASALHLEGRAVGLDDPARLDEALSGVQVVLHAAGPFSRTSGPMADACLRTRTHYLDITGEIGVFESMAARDGEARARNVMLLPGVGFDVVPTDCLAAHLKNRLPSATHLLLAIDALGRPSRGTTMTAVENMHRGGVVRRDGRLTPVPAAWHTRVVDFGTGPKEAVTIPWGDVATAYYSTGIPNIEVFAALPPSVRRTMVATRYVGWLLASPPVQGVLKRWIAAGQSGPTDAQRAAARSVVWGQVRDEQGNAATSRLRTPDGYTLTAMTAVAAVRRVLDGHATPGFQTPSRVYGADFVLECPGVERADIDG